jgi:hypothetical protein
MGCGSLLAALALMFLKLDQAPPEAIEAEKAAAEPSVGVARATT